MARLNTDRRTQETLRTLSTIIGQLSCIQTRCVTLMGEAGDTPVEVIGPQGQDNLGEHLFHTMLQAWTIQSRLYDVSNDIRGQEGLEELPKSEAYSRSQALLTSVLEDAAKCLKDS